MCSLLLATFLVCLVAEMDLNIYNNTVLVGTASNTIALQSLNYSIPYKNAPFSAQIVGSITWPTAVDKYYIDCIFDSSLRGIVKIDDHLICAPNVYRPPQFEYWNLTWTSSAYNTRHSFIRIDLYSNIQNNKDINDLNFKVLWSFNDNSSFHIINNTYLSTHIPSQQKTRMILQNNLTQNSFSTWFAGNMLSIIRMPDSFGLTFGICDGNNSTNCLLQDIIENNHLWVGLHAYDHSYFEYNISYNGYNIQYQYSSVIKNKTYSDLYTKITLLSTKTPPPFIAFSSRFYWGRYGQQMPIHTYNKDMNCFINIDAHGLSHDFNICSNIKANTTQNGSLLFLFHHQNVIYFTTDTHISTVRDIDVIINTYLALEYATYDKYGTYKDTKQAIQSGLMWNMIYTVEESGPFFPVGRGWDKSDDDYGMVIFDWDNIFASYQLSMDALDLSISNLVQVIKSKTCHGFVPNYKWAGGGILRSSEDRTEPPIGAMVLDKMYIKYGDSILWLIELLFHDLYDWVNWFWVRRRCAPKNLICLGSDPNVPDVSNGENTMQSARFESGLDNSPMYDGQFFNTKTHHMMLYDVGMTSMFMNEVKHLIHLGKAIAVDDDTLNILQQRYDIMLNLTLNELWDEKSNIFVNKWSINDTFYRRISPTLFYPLLTGDIDVERAESMVNKYLLNKDYFCISLEFPVNQSADCYYGLPSIARSDPAFKSQNYWRGLTWGPMVQLVWWSLDEYVEESVVVKNAQRALMKQMNEMMLNMWYSKRHICENYSPSNHSNDCTGDHFYHWGGLTGFVSLIHDYY